MEQVGSVVIGAGVVGLAVARALAQAGQSVLILEAAGSIGSGISARNSEVIHAGLYYPAGSLKARLCRRGGALLYDFCARHAVDHRRCGKLIVAGDPAQEAALTELLARARANGVDDLIGLSGAEARAREPALACAAALLSPSTGIVDSHGLMLALLGDAERAGATLARRVVVSGGAVDRNGLQVHTPDLTLRARRVVNCAGLGAQALALAWTGMAATQVPPLALAKGNYFSLRGRAPFSHLIYPAPEAHGLGIHLTLDLAGQARFGPDVEWVDREDYAVDPARAASFEAAIRRYWPGLPDNHLQPAYAGIRPKPHQRNEAGRDFLICGPEAHGIPGLVHLFGIESPGLTAALAIGEHVAELLR